MRTPVAAAIAALFATSPSFASEPTLPDVIVPGMNNSPYGSLSQPDPQPWAHSQVGRAGLKVLGGPAQISPYRLMELMPSVNTESADGYGMSATRNLNIRGKSDFHISRNIENIPLTGTNHGANDFIDLENVARFELHRSAIPAWASLGVSHTTGVMNMDLRRPEDKFGAELSMAFGSDHFKRIFARIDSGRFGPANSAFFLSASQTEADKWKGAGQSGDRSNFMLGFAQPLPNGGKFELFTLQNENEAHTYRAMNYTQMQNESNWQTWDYNTDFNPAIGQRQNWHGFNRITQKDTAVIANLVLPIGEQGKSGTITFRPYWWDNDGYTLSANGNNVRRWDIVHETTGFTLQYDVKLASALDLTTGYWWMDQDSPPPPVYQKDYTPQADGSLVFNRWALLSKHGTHQFRSPYLQLTGKTGNTTISGGMRLHEQLQPSFSYYTNASLPDVSYDTIWSSNPALDPWQQVAEKTTRTWLPNLSVRHELNSALALTAAYGRRLGRADWGPVASTYNSNKAKFTARNVSLQNVFSGLEPERSDNVDLGLRYDNERVALAANLYYAISRKKEVSLYDPIVDVSYYQSVAKAIAQGIELEGSYRLSPQFSTLFALSYNRYAFDGDIQSRSGVLTPADGKQVPNSARILAKLGIDWKSGAWSLTPVMRYVGKRYGDVLNTQKVDSYFLADLNMAYQWQTATPLREASLGLAIQSKRPALPPTPMSQPQI
jgi:iron complex outermembrane receptor protein